MTTIPDRPIPAVTLEQLIGLNDQILAIVRAGVPLELGLAAGGKDAREGMGAISLRLAERMSRGASLPEALSAPGEPFPPVYRAVVEAGLKAGRLPAALESVSDLGRAVLDLRQRIGIAMIYPLIVLSVAYGIFLVFVTALVDRFQDAYAGFHLPVHGALQVLIALRDTIAWWGWLLPVLLAGGVGWWSITIRRATLSIVGRESGLGWVPGIGRIATNYFWATFADLLALLIEQQVPLPEAVVLAADATGQPRMQESARHLAAAIAGGQTWTASRELPGFPTFLKWLMTQGQQQGNLVPALRQFADGYRRRAQYGIEWIRLAFPSAAALLIGGGAAFCYALSLFLPLVGFMEDLAAP